MDNLNEIQTQKKQSLINIGKVDDNQAMTEMWGLNPAIIQEISKSAMIRSSKHGMFASVPIVCRTQCAYRDVCTVDKAHRIQGQRCPMEIGALIARFNQWCEHFGLDTTQDMIKEDELTDATLIRDLVNLEIQMMRCENKIAISGDFMAVTLKEIDKKCKPYYEEIVSPESEYMMTLQNNKIKILNQLNATRKDKAADKSRNASPTENAIKIFQQVQEAIKNQAIIDVETIDFDDEVEEIDTNSENKVTELIETPVEE